MKLHRKINDAKVMGTKLINKYTLPFSNYYKRSHGVKLLPIQLYLYYNL